ncbi:ABC transporter permease [Massilia sp. DWR3-1-1]|uniref:ABC transporter permease n=1 Tax=Massilia sp. DWR3-1-1 TaxID=2804559 RepID=UPI003CF24715
MKPWLLCYHEIVSDLRIAARTPGFLVPTVLTPLGFYCLFVYGVHGAGGVAGAARLMVNYAIFGAMAPALFGLGTALAADRTMAWIDLRRASPLPATVFIAGKLGYAALLTLASTLPIMFAASCAGVVLAPLNWALLVAVNLLASLLFSSIGLAIGLLLEQTAAAVMANVLFLPLAFFGGLWFPLGALHPLLQDIGAFTPTYRLGNLGLMGAGLIQTGDWMFNALALWAWLLLAGVALWRIFCGWLPGHPRAEAA